MECNSWNPTVRPEIAPRHVTNEISNKCSLGGMHSLQFVTGTNQFALLGIWSLSLKHGEESITQWRCFWSRTIGRHNHANYQRFLWAKILPFGRLLLLPGSSDNQIARCSWFLIRTVCRTDPPIKSPLFLWRFVVQKYHDFWTKKPPAEINFALNITFTTIIWL